MIKLIIGNLLLFFIVVLIPVVTILYDNEVLNKISFWIGCLMIGFSMAYLSLFWQNSNLESYREWIIGQKELSKKLTLEEIFLRATISSFAILFLAGIVLILP